MESGAVVERTAMRPAHELQRVFLAHRLEADPHHRDLLAHDRQIRGILMPWGAAALTAFLEKHLLIHEPYVGRIPKLGGYIGRAGFIEQAMVSGQRSRIEQVLVELGGRVRGSLKLRGIAARMTQAPLKS